MLNLNMAKTKHPLFALTIGIFFGFTSAYLLLLSLFSWSSRPQCTLLDLYPYNHTKEEDGIRHLPDGFRFREDSTVAKKLYDKIKVLCWVMTSGEFHKTRAVHIRETWGRRCNKLLFMTNVHDARLPVVVLNASTTNEDYWHKTVQALEYLYINKFHEYDWFAKADDTTFYIVENLRYILSQYDPSQAFIFGVKYHHDSTPDGYISDKAGYVLSKQALQRLVIHGFPNSQHILKG